MSRVQELCTHEWAKGVRKPMQEGEDGVGKARLEHGVGGRGEKRMSW